MKVFYRNIVVKIIHFILLVASSITFSYVSYIDNLSSKICEYIKSGTLEYTMNMNILLASIFLLIYSSVVLIITAGRTNRKSSDDYKIFEEDLSIDKVNFLWFDKAYTEIYFLASTILIIAMYYVLRYAKAGEDIYSTLVGLLTCLLYFPLASIVKNIKAGTLLKNTLIYDICMWVEEGFTYFLSSKNFRDRQNIRAILIILLCFIPILGWIIALVLSLKWKDDLTCDVEDLKNATEKMKSGNYDIDIEEIIDNDIYEIGQDMKKIGENIEKMVEDRVKEEKERIEEILNASYDLKNPLESIVETLNLIDENISDPKLVKKYTDVIKHRTKRLVALSNEIITGKRLKQVELRSLDEKAENSKNNEIDLINIDDKKEELDNIKAYDNLEILDVFSFLTKGLSEIEQEMKNAKLNIKLNVKKSKLTAYADKNNLWRAFENLIKDIFKHAKKETNVYITVSGDDDFAMISMKNEIADDEKEKMNITNDEFRHEYLDNKERISSLTVAKRLIEKQLGKLRINIDNGYFETTIQMKNAKKIEKEENNNVTKATINSKNEDEARKIDNESNIIEEVKTKEDKTE